MTITAAASKAQGKVEPVPETQLICWVRDIFDPVMTWLADGRPEGGLCPKFAPDEAMASSTWRAHGSFSSSSFARYAGDSSESRSG